MRDPMTPQELGPLMDFQVRVNAYLLATTRAGRVGAMLNNREMDEMRESHRAGDEPEVFAALLTRRDEWVARAAGIVDPDGNLARSRRDPQTESPSYRSQMRDAGRMR